MTRDDLIRRERENAALYRAEARRRGKNPALAAQLNAWAEASERRAEALRCGPLFAEAA